MGPWTGIDPRPVGLGTSLRAADAQSGDWLCRDKLADAFPVLRSCLLSRDISREKLRLSLLAWASTTCPVSCCGEWNIIDFAWCYISMPVCIVWLACVIYVGGANICPFCGFALWRTVSFVPQAWETSHLTHK